MFVHLVLLYKKVYKKQLEHLEGSPVSRFSNLMAHWYSKGIDANRTTERGMKHQTYTSVTPVANKQESIRLAPFDPEIRQRYCIMAISQH